MSLSRLPFDKGATLSARQSESCEPPRPEPWGESRLRSVIQHPIPRGGRVDLDREPPLQVIQMVCGLVGIRSRPDRIFDAVTFEIAVCTRRQRTGPKGADPGSAATQARGGQQLYPQTAAADQTAQSGLASGPVHFWPQTREDTLRKPVRFAIAELCDGVIGESDGH